MSQVNVDTEDIATKLQDFDRTCNDYIQLLYENVTGFVSYQPGEKEEAAEKLIFMTYGEILYAGVNRLIDAMKITQDDVLYDLGSGVGKVALQFFIKTPIKKAVGLEAHKERNQSAVQVYNQVKKELPALFHNRVLDSICENFLEYDFTDATILFVPSTCYGDELQMEIGKRADLCPNLKYIISHKVLPNKFPLNRMIDIECSWDTENTHFYVNPELEPTLEPVLELEK